jgi:eukaryotic-like serine/threonine-protein kinase
VDTPPRTKIRRLSFVVIFTRRESLKGTTLYHERYTLDEQIGFGGFAKIYRAIEQEQQEAVAIKVAADSDDPSCAKSLREEARIIQRFEHQSIVRLRAIPRRDKGGELFCANALDLPGAPVFFVMEYLRGGTLASYLQQVGRLSVPEAAAIALQVGRALDHMHQRGYAHNDLKLENVVFRQPIVAGEAFEPVLIDFGIATRVQQPSAGSLYIMPPEQLAKVKLASPPEIADSVDRTKIDVWGLGVVLYRMLGGQLPFSGRSERGLTQQVYYSRPVSLIRFNAEIPREVDELVIDGCLAKNPAHRLSLLDIGRALSGMGIKDVVAQYSADARKTRGILDLLFGRYRI